MALPVTTLVPFSTLPACASSCGHLYDVNGACVPPAAPTGDLGSYANCFCSNALLTPFSTGTAGVCDSACTAAGDQGGLASIQGWYTSFCAANAKGVVATTTTTGGSGSSTGGSSSSKSGAGGGNNSWLSTHWQWVIFIVIVVVGIIAIWVGACVWHRRYVRRKDRQYALGNVRASTGAASGTAGLHNPSQHDVHSGAREAGVFAPGTESEKRHSSLLSRRRD